MSRARRYVIVVSGLPRSGTSLAMQMLRAGGIPLLCDGARAPDADNPRGYFEYEPVKRSATDASWVDRAPGRAVKVIAQLVRHLPPRHEYRVVLMRRNLADVIASQERMLARRGDAGSGGLAAARLAEVYAAQLAEVTEWLATTPGVRICELHFEETVRRPARAAAAIDELLDGGLERSGMTAVVDKP